MAIKADANYASIIVENVRDKWLGWPRVIHEAIQLTTYTPALLGYLFAGGGIGFGKFIENCSGLNESKKISLIYLAGRLDIIKVSITKGLQYKGFILLENYEVHQSPH